VLPFSGFWFWRPGLVGGRLNKTVFLFQLSVFKTPLQGHPAYLVTVLSIFTAYHPIKASFILVTSMRIPLLFLPTLLGKVAAGASPGCVSDEGKAVDWFLAMKMPNGGSYHYFDAVTKSFALSEKDMSKGGDCVDQTLSSLYSSDKEKDAYGMWSDQPTHDKAAGSIYAHSKGIFHVDEKQGWYVLHSMPSFPTAQSLGYQELPDVKYGQTFLCMTMEAGEFDKLGSDLQTMHAYFYDSFYSEELEELIPNMVNATNKVENKDEQVR